MKKRILGSGMSLILVAGMLILGIAPASATGSQATPCVPSAAYHEVVVDHAAYDEKVIDVEAQPAVPGTDAVYGPTEYQFEHAPNGVYKTRWETDPNWNANDNENSTGWRSTGEPRQELITPAVPGKDAVEEVSHVVTHEAVTRTVPHDAVVCPPPVDQFTPYEVTVCWSMDNPDLSTPGTHEWPQTRASCPVPASTGKCEGGKYQVDTYWIRDVEDEEYLAALTVLNSPADDARLEPHDYYAAAVPGDASKCESVPPVDAYPDVEGDQPVGTDRTSIVPEESPVVTPPVDKPVNFRPKPQMPVDEASAVLPNTGGPDILFAGLGVALLIAGGVAVAVGTKRRKA